MHVIRDLTAAFGVAFQRPWAYLIATGSATGMGALLVWNSGMASYYANGWEVYATRDEILTIAVLSILFGAMVPLQIAAVRRSRSTAARLGPIAATASGILSISCCAPLLVPGLLSFVGFSGTALASFNASMRAYTTPLALASIILMAASVGLVSHKIAAACRIPTMKLERAKNAPSPQPSPARGERL